MPFKDRIDAGRRLGEALREYRDRHPVVLALPRGGVLVAAEVAKALDAPLDIILVRKIGVPRQEELAMGAVVDGDPPITVRNDKVIRGAHVRQKQFDKVRSCELAEIQRRRQRYLGTRDHIDIKDRIVIIVDDGIATGATMRAALHALRLREAMQIIIAVPVGPPDTLATLRENADAVLCLEEYPFLGSIGAYYEDFRQVSDAEVITALAQCSAVPSA
jgi:putative phosphoribosyl transferase